MAGIVEEHGLEGVFGPAGIVDDGSGEKFGENHAAVGRPAEGIDDVTERTITTSELLAFEETTALAARILKPNIVVLEVVFFGLEMAIDGIGDAAVGGVGEGGDFLVDGLEWLVEILSFGGRQRAAAHDGTHERTETTEPTKAAERTGTSHCLGPGCGPVYSEQQGFCTGVNSMNSTRVSSGS